ncbi:MAG: hypothetical protein PHS77_06265, partial [Gallionellaceae bacterium]|nr:hypothetical protein [Gallionellaceae bacterium]
QPVLEHDPARRAAQGDIEIGRLGSQMGNLSHGHLFAQLDGHNPDTTEAAFPVVAPAGLRP